MPDLSQSLLNRDIGHLRVIAGLWGIEINAIGTEAVLAELVTACLDSRLIREMVDALQREAKLALTTLVEADGKIPWANFARQFGEIRDVGPGRRDREQVYLKPASAAEALFYRALIARAFFDTSTGTQEFAYIPDDLLEIIKNELITETKAERKDNLPAIPGKQTPSGSAPGRPASQKEKGQRVLSCDRLLEDATTILAAMRMGMGMEKYSTHIPAQVVMDFLSAAKITGEGAPRIEPVRAFLEASREQALEALEHAWEESDSFNELRQLPGLTCEGEWTNQPRVTRAFLMHLLDNIPEDQWWSLPALVRTIKEKFPDFQRPAGDYDSWFIKREVDGVYLRGFGVWEEVDGALVRYLINGPLYWLGRVELATPVDDPTITAFRILPRKVTTAKPENARLHVTSQGKINVPALFSRSARYQIARFCEWDEEKDDGYRYRVTAGSLQRAAGKGLKVSQLLSLLAKNSASELPPAFVKALKRWEIKGTEARVEVQTILRVSSPEVLEALRKSKAGRFLGELLGPVSVVIKPGAQAKILTAIAELGLLAELSNPDSENKSS
jgi:hypothetical protein